MNRRESFRAAAALFGSVFVSAGSSKSTGPARGYITPLPGTTPESTARITYTLGTTEPDFDRLYEIHAPREPFCYQQDGIWRVEITQPITWTVS